MSGSNTKGFPYNMTGVLFCCLLSNKCSDCYNWINMVKYNHTFTTWVEGLERIVDNVCSVVSAVIIVLDFIYKIYRDYKK